MFPEGFCRHWRRDRRRRGRRSIHWHGEWNCPLGPPSIFVLGPSQAKVGDANPWRRRSLRVYLVPHEHYSSITPPLLHVLVSNFPVRDQYSGDPFSAAIQATEHQVLSLCRSLADEEKSQLLGPLITSWCFRNCFIWFRSSWVHHVFCVVRDWWFAWQT